ncbi:unnamed protein product, partial [Laminaria digitata]
SGGGGTGSGSGSGSSGVSYVKLTAPVSIPLSLDLSRFCTRYTGNPPVDELGQAVESLKALGLPPTPAETAPAPGSNSSALAAAVTTARAAA